MDPLSQTGHIRLTSLPSLARSGRISLLVGLALGWIFVGLWSAVAYLTFSKNVYFAVSLVLAIIVFVICLTYFCFGLLKDSWCDYVFEITDTEAILVTINRLTKLRKTNMVLLKDIKYAEYYPYGDSASIILYASYAEMEVPLWPMGTRGQDVADFLNGRGVKVVNVQSDDQYPTEH